MPGRFIDLTGMEMPGGWMVSKCSRYGGNKPTMWLARHKCGNEQELRADQLRSGRDTLCKQCGKRTARADAARVASSMAARKPREKQGTTLLQRIDLTKRAIDRIGKASSSKVEPKREPTTWETIRSIQAMID